MSLKLYFRFAAGAPPGAPTIAVGLDDWGYTSEYAVGSLARTKVAGDTIDLGTQIGPWTSSSTQKALDRRFVFGPLAGGTTSSATWKCQLQVREYASADDVDQVITKLYIIKPDGSLRATLTARSVTAARSPSSRATDGARRS